MGLKQITIQSPPSTDTNVHYNYLKAGDFDSAIWDKGIDVYHDKMVLCPCSSVDGGVVASLS